MVPVEDVWALCSGALGRLRAQYDTNNNNMVDLTEFREGAAAAYWTQGACLGLGLGLGLGYDSS